MIKAASAVVDLRRPVDAGALIGELKARRWERLFAVTPLAAWTLEEAGLAFENNSALVERRTFRAGSLGNFERVRRALLAAFGPEHESWMGLMLQITVFASYALAEDMRRRSLEGLDLHVFSDVPLETRDNVSLEAHLYNGCALYFQGLPADRHHEAARRSETLARLINRVKRLTPASLAQKILSLAPRSAGPSLVTDFGYDWAALRPHLVPRYSQRTFAQLASEAARFEGPEPDPMELDAFAAALESEFRDLLPRMLAPFVAAARDRAARYAALRARFDAHMPALAERHDLRAALGTMCGTDEQFLAHYYLKKAGRPSVIYQHGAYIQHWEMVGPAEVLPATHNLAYGSSDAAFMSGLRLGADIHRVGSVLLESIAADRPRKGDFLYALYHNPGNLLLAESELAHVETDHAALFHRHRRVIELFSGFKGLSLTIRPHPAQYTWGLYEPLREFVARRRIANIRFDQSPLDPDRYFAGYEGVILDYPSTGLLQAMTKGRNIACHIGNPYRVPAEAQALLSRAASCAEDDDAFLAVLKRWFSHGADAGDPSAREEFLSRYGKAERPTLSVLLPLLDKILS